MRKIIPLKRHKRLRAHSIRGEIIKECLELIRLRLLRERGDICEIHNRKCANIGMMHILNKRRYPRLRFNSFNILLAGWFCSHFWTHQDPDDSRAIFTMKRIKELRGADYKEKLLVMDKTAPKHTMVFLQTYLLALKKEEKK
jgi:hypothetical protein